jgi:hypothetical protein
VSKTDRIVERIAQGIGVPDLVDKLSALPASELGSLLLAVMRAQSKERTPADLLAQLERSKAVAPANVDPRAMNRFARSAFEAAAAFEPIELAPIAPLGTNAVLSDMDQNIVLSAVRNAEVLSDPTTMAALIAAQRRRDGRSRSKTVKLAAISRLLRLQTFDFPGYWPHFGVFSLSTGGRDTGADRFETEALLEQLDAHLTLLETLQREGLDAKEILVAISDTELVAAVCSDKGIDREDLRRSIRTHQHGSAESFLRSRGVDLPRDVKDPGGELAGLASGGAFARALLRLSRAKTEVADVLGRRHPNVQTSFDASRLAGLGYYSGLCMRIDVVCQDGRRMNLGDGGFTHWTRALLSDAKERFLGTGLGVEAVCRLLPSR